MNNYSGAYGYSYVPSYLNYSPAFSLNPYQSSYYYMPSYYGYGRSNYFGYGCDYYGYYSYSYRADSPRTGCAPFGVQRVTTDTYNPYPGFYPFTNTGYPGYSACTLCFYGGYGIR